MSAFEATGAISLTYKNVILHRITSYSIILTEHDVVKVAVFPQPPKSLEMLPCNTMPVIPFHFSYYLFLFPSLCRSLRVLFKFICDLQYGNAPCIWPRGGGQKKKKKKIGGFPSRRSQIFFFFFCAPPPPAWVGLGRTRKFKGKKAKGKERNKQKLQETA